MTPEHDIDRRLAEARAAFEAAGPPREQFQCGLRYADLLADKGGYQQAIDVLTRIRPLAGDGFEQGVVSQRCGWAYVRISKYDKALYNLREALNLLGARQGSFELALVYHDMAWMHYRQGYLEQARSYAENAELALRCLPSRQDPQVTAVQADCHHLCSMIESADGKYQEAIDRAEQGIIILERSNDILGLSAAYNKLSSIYQTTGAILRAFDYQRTSLELAERSGNPYRRSISLKNLGELHYVIGDLERAFQCHSDSLALSLQAENLLGYIFNHAGMGRIHQARGDSDTAAEELQLALAKSREIRCRDRESALLADLADLCCDCGSHRVALRHLERAAALDNERGQDPSPWHAVVAARALLGADQPGRWQEAAEQLHGVLSRPLVIGDEEFISIPELTMAARLLLGNAYHRLGIGPRARESYALAKRLADEFCREFTADQQRSYRQRRMIAEIDAAAAG